MSLNDRLSEFLVDHMVLRNERILVAVSGGIDSMVLLHILAIRDHPIHVAHVNHGKREASAQEEEFIKDWCANQNIKTKPGPRGAESATELVDEADIVTAGR